MLQLIEMESILVSQKYPGVDHMAVHHYPLYRPVEPSFPLLPMEPRTEVNCNDPDVQNRVAAVGRNVLATVFFSSAYAILSAVVMGSLTSIAASTAAVYMFTNCVVNSMIDQAAPGILGPNPPAGKKLMAAITQVVLGILAGIGMANACGMPITFWEGCAVSICTAIASIPLVILVFALGLGAILAVNQGQN